MSVLRSMHPTLNLPSSGSNTGSELIGIDGFGFIIGIGVGDPVIMFDVSMDGFGVGDPVIMFDVSMDGFGVTTNGNGVGAGASTTILGIVWTFCNGITAGNELGDFSTGSSSSYLSFCMFIIPHASKKNTPV